MNYESPFTDHAKTQIEKRYGVEFDNEQWRAFGWRLRDSNMTIRLSDTKEGCHFLASYFIGHWYLLVCTKDGTVKTAYSRTDITDDDKQILMRDKRYRQINDDAFHVWSNSPSKVAMPLRENAVELPDEEELPSDLRESAEHFMKTFCDKEQ